MAALRCRPLPDPVAPGRRAPGEHRAPADLAAAGGDRLSAGEGRLGPGICDRSAARHAPPGLASRRDPSLRRLPPRAPRVVARDAEVPLYARGTPPRPRAVSKPVARRRIRRAVLFVRLRHGVAAAGDLDRAIMLNLEVRSGGD